jgi:hypothetical protein
MLHAGAVTSEMSTSAAAGSTIATLVLAMHAVTSSKILKHEEWNSA